ncbi:Rho termination factor N-terminal domain-containing protein [Rhodococcus sp. JT-3]|uniref:Rho termination factor N-terminal domain-containing protein n=1 Tax=Rhodococcus sp. JT-3 TaxID=1973213 RepID=UPI001303938C|nr:Rho termination factor N-terminal domain-containing protein [Rhodococcus sp. JT-3]
MSGRLGADTVVLTCDLSTVSTEHSIRDRLTSTEIEAWKLGTTQLFLTLDSFDEAQTRIADLRLILNECMEDWDFTRLFLRIACRTLDWPPLFTQQLSDRFDEDISPFELLPLRRTDAQTIVSAWLDEPEGFIAAVDKVGVAPLAARPLTLRFLANSYASHHQLPDRTAEIYELGLTALCDEHSPERTSSPRHVLTTPDVAMDMAARVAAISRFSGRPAIWTGPVTEASADDMNLSDCIRLPAPGAPLEPISFDDVRSLWASGLFNGAGTSRIVWAHATFADFLTARWIERRRLTIPQIKSLLLADDQCLYQHARTIASWLVAINPIAHQWLADLDPEAFAMGTDLPDVELRKRVVAGLLRATHTGTIDPRPLHDYRQLQHPDLADQLRNAPSLQNEDVFEMTAMIAIDCEVIELIPDFARFALDDAQVNGRIRMIAAQTVRTLSRSAPTDCLLPLTLAISTAGGDADASVGALELQGIALSTSFPHAMSVADVFGELRSTATQSVYGLYWRFVREFAAHIGPEDVDCAAEWVTTTPAVVSDSKFDRLVDSIAALSIRHIDESSKASEAIAIIALTRADDYQPLFSERIIDEQPELTRIGRRTLARVLLSRASSEQIFGVMYRFLKDDEPLFSSDDLAWLIDEFAGADDTTRDNIATAMQQLINPDNPEHAHLVLDLDDHHPVAERLAYLRGSVDLDSDIAKHYRKMRAKADARRDRPTSSDFAFDVDEAISELSQKAKDGDLAAYAEATQMVCLPHLGKTHAQPFQPDLTKQPRWKQMTAPTQLALVQSSRRFLTSGRCDGEQQRGAYLCFDTSAAGYKALILLLREDPATLRALPGPVWREWAPIMVNWGVASNGANAGDKIELFSLALPHARSELTEALLELLDHRLSDGEYALVTVEMRLLDSPELAAELLARSDSYGVENPTGREIFTFLVSNHLDLVQPKLEMKLKSAIGEEREEVVSAGVALFRRDTQTIWPTIEELMLTDPALVLEIMSRVAEADRYTAPDLEPSALARLYVWLRRTAPPPTRSVGEANFLDGRDYIDRWANTILQKLIDLGSEDSVLAVQEISLSLPEQRGLRQAVTLATNNFRNNHWKPLNAYQLDEIAENPANRIVRTPADLAVAAQEALVHIQNRLQGDTPSAPLLWDTHSQRPKQEDDISDFLRTELADTLGARGAVVNREVQVRRSGRGIGERTDIRIDAQPQGGSNQITLVIEVKGCWNPELRTAWKTQLLERYMADTHTHHGVYLIAWFDQNSWTAKDSRRAKARPHRSPQELQSTLQADIDSSIPARCQIEVVVLDLSLVRPVPLSSDHPIRSRHWASTVTELRLVAKSAEIQSYLRMRKGDLIEAIEAAERHQGEH